MCNLLDLIEERWGTRGMAKNLVSMVERFVSKNNFSIDKACELLDVEVYSYNAAKRLIPGERKHTQNC